MYDENILTDIVKLARKYELAIFADEIYGKITFNNARFIPIASLSNDVITVSFSGLSKSYRLAGFRCGWMVLSGAKQRAQSYIEGLDILSNMRLCSNVPAQFAVEPALNKDSYAKELTLPGSRLEKQRDITKNLLSAIPGAIGTMGCLTTVLLCVLLENTIRQISSPDVFLEFIIKNRRLIRLPVPIFAISIHGISLQIIFYTWKCGIILGTITGSITLVSCGVVHYYQQNFQNMLKEHRKNTFLEMSII